MTPSISRSLRLLIFRSLVVLLVASFVSGHYFALAQSADETPLVPVPVEGGSAKLNARNTRIEFVGLHTGRDPRPRLGGFKKFDGVLVFDEEKLEKISVEIQIASIWTEFDKLTQHLQAADFLNAKEFPTARFQSTTIKPGKAAGEYEVTGKLKLHGTEEEITFTAKVEPSAKGVVLESEFKIDRVLFGMNEHLDGVEKLVSVKVSVGRPTRDADKPAKAEDPATQSQPVDLPPSGLAVGQSVEPWTPLHVAGPDKGTRTCPVCTYLSRPAIVVFAKQGPNTRQLLVEVENLLARHEKAELKGFVTLLDSTSAELEQLAADEQIVLTSLCLPDAETGEKDLAAYRVNSKVDNTIIVYRDYKVVATFVDLEAKKFGQVREVVEKLSGAGR